MDSAYRAFFIRTTVFLWLKYVEIVQFTEITLWFLYTTSVTRIYCPNHLFNIVFLVAAPCYSICRNMQFVTGGPFRAWSASLCCHSTNKMHCAHIYLKIVCSVCCWRSTPPSISPVLIQSAIVWIMITIGVRACRHSGICYFVPVLYTNSSTFWETQKAN